MQCNGREKCCVRLLLLFACSPARARVRRARRLLLTRYVQLLCKPAQRWTEFFLRKPASTAILFSFIFIDDWRRRRWRCSPLPATLPHPLSGVIGDAGAVDPLLANPCFRAPAGSSCDPLTDLGR